MVKRTPELTKAVEEAVTRLERGTSAEVVVVLAGRADPYPEAAALAAGVVATLLLATVLYSPIVFTPALVLPGVVLVTALAAWSAQRAPELARLLTTRSRRLRAVERAARAAFVEQAVHGTRERSGLLVFVSALEGRVVLVPDLGLRRVVAPGALHALRWGPGDDAHAIGSSEDLLSGLSALGELLSAAAPPGEDNPDELPDAPVVQP